MPGANVRAEELRGWKQIADYLRVSIRTAQNMEKEQRLPVRRGAGIKGQVFALPAEIDEWRLHKKPSPASVPLEPEPFGAVGQNRRRWLYAVGGSTFLAVGGAADHLLSRLTVGRNGVPAQFRVEGPRLIISDNQGRELWTHVFGEELIESAYVREIPRLCQFADLGDDNQIETIFSVMPRSTEAERSLLCFSSDGRPRWKFVPGKTVIDNLGRSFAPPYWPNGFQVVRSKLAAPSKIVVSSNHNWSFPNQVAVLDGRTGRLLSQYWHRGHLLHMAMADIDGDGEPELLLGGVNDAPEYRRATLVVFDIDKVSGASRNPGGEVNYKGMDPGTEKRIVFFPRTPLSQGFEFNRLSLLTVTPGRIRAHVAESTREDDPCYVVYELDFNLRPVNTGLSNGFMERYRQLQTAGQLPKEALAIVAERLKSEIVVI
jgi:hypothetical protein